MKTLFSSMFVVALLLCGCTSDKDKDPVKLQASGAAIAALNDVNMCMVQKFKEYDNEMAYVSRRIDREGMSTSNREFIVKSLQSTDTFIRMAGMIDNDGQRIFNYPNVYFSKGGDPAIIDNAAVVMDKVKRGYSVFTGAYKNKLNELVANYIWPVKGEDEIVHGAIYIQISMTDLLRHYVAREISGMPLNIWVMQTDGLILYDTDMAEIGVNLFSDKHFSGYPSLVELGKKIVQYETGTGEYKYISKGNKVEILKSTQWNSVSLGGRQLRIILNIEDRSFVK